MEMMGRVEGNGGSNRGGWRGAEEGWRGKGGDGGPMERGWRRRRGDGGGREWKEGMMGGGGLRRGSLLEPGLPHSQCWRTRTGHRRTGVYPTPGCRVGPGSTVPHVCVSWGVPAGSDATSPHGHPGQRCPWLPRSRHRPDRSVPAAAPVSQVPPKSPCHRAGTLVLPSSACGTGPAFPGRRGSRALYPRSPRQPPAPVPLPQIAHRTRLR